MTITDIKNYVEWAGKLWPEGKEALDFVVTEVGEAMDAYIRQFGRAFKRNNQDKNMNLAYELGDIYIMTQIASYELTGRSVEENARLKLESKGFYLDYQTFDDSTADWWKDKLREGSYKKWDADRFTDIRDKGKYKRG